MAIITHTDDYGRVTINPEDLVEALYAGVHIPDLLTNPGNVVDQFNELCARFDRPKIILHSPTAIKHTPAEEHARRSAEWVYPKELDEVDLRVFFLSMCETDDQRARVHEEMDLFEDRGLQPLLRSMIFLVDHWRKNNVFWGVGRGSSVASYILHLIGINRIDPMRYGLTIHEFLR